MKSIFLCILGTCFLLVSCKESIELHNVWVKKPSFDTLFRSWPVGFAIGGKGYVGLGYTRTFKTDWWEYNPEANTWLKKSDFPGTPRVESFSTSDEQNGYIGMGTAFSDGGITSFEDIWQYHAADDKWSALTVAPFHSGLRTPASFVIDNKLFLTNRQELWAFDLIAKIWARKRDLPFAVLNFHNNENGKTIVISNRAYFFFTDTSPTVSYEFARSFSVWRYDVTLDTWSQVINKLSGPQMDWGSLFVLEDGVYVADSESQRYQKINTLEGPSYALTELVYEVGLGGDSFVGYSINNDGYAFVSGKGGFWQYVR